MLVIKPDYYDDFQCIAANCPKSCCKGWQIVIDAAAIEKYKMENGSVFNRIRNSIMQDDETEELMFQQFDGRCAMLDEDELCAIHREAGEEYLSQTCSMYPRHVEEYMDVREYSLSLSCPEAARIILSRELPVSFIESETDEMEEDYEFDYFLYEILVEARKSLLSIAQNRSLPIIERMAWILAITKEMQRVCDDEQLYLLADFEDWRNRSEVLAGTEEKRKAYLFNLNNESHQKELFSELLSLEILEDDWEEILQQTLDCMTVDADCLQDNEVQLEQILVFFLYTYFCGAVYDEWIFSKAALSVYSTLWIAMIAKARGKSIVEAAYLYAREIEHSDPNLEALEEFLDERG